MVQTDVKEYVGEQPAGRHETEAGWLELEHVSLGYGGRVVLQDMSCRVPHGARVAVIGPNGAGKSTLFKALAGLLPLLQGHVLIHGRPLTEASGPTAYVPQHKEVDWGFPVTAQDVVLMGRYRRMGWFRRPGREDRTIAARCLERMGIGYLAQAPIGELSGGQQQRVFLARALAQEPHILLLDEPFTGVDISTQETTMALLDQLEEQQVTVLLSTHDLNMAMSHFEQVLLLNHRLIACGEAAEVFTPETLSEAFGEQLLQLPGGALLVDQCCPPGRSGDGGRR